MYHNFLELLCQSPLKPPNTLNYFSWKRPLDTFIKLNTDRSVYQEGRSAPAGGVLRNSNGAWLLGFMANLGWCDIISAEFWAIYQGLILSWNNGWKYIMVESDSSLAINMLKQNSTNPSRHLPLIVAIKDLCARSWQVRFEHTYQETNKVADLLSKKARGSLDGVSILNDPPDEILILLEDDRNGKLYARYSYR